MKTLYTIGHSNRNLQEFLDILDYYKIIHLVDIRALPKSKYVPWFNKMRLKSELNKRNIAYTHLKELGGLRHTTENSINKGWKNLSFRAFADYMQTKEFFYALKSLNNLIQHSNGKIAIMCAEAVPWKCHRSLIADAELVRKITVFDIISITNVKKHKLTGFAIVARHKRPIRIYYPEDLNNSLF